MCDCLISSSNYEGQGIVLLEAMIARKHVLGTNVEGNKSILKGNKNSLMENSVKGLAEGIERYIRGEVPLIDFDYLTYNQESMDQFYKIVIQK